MFVRNMPSLRQEDFPKETASSMSKLFRILTPYFNSVTSVINGSVDFVDNIASVTSDYDLTNVQVPINIQWPFNGNPPRDLRITKALGANSATILLAAWSFDVSTNTIAISQILEAPAMVAPVVGRRYQFTVRATI